MKILKGMKKRYIIVFILVLMSVIAIFMFFAEKKPFKRLNASEIVSAEVLLMPPDKTVQIIETEELAGYLNDVVIYNTDNSYRNYAGQAVIFSLTLSNGAQMEITAYNPFLVINGVGYRTKYEPCEALNRYANRLLDEEDSIIIVKEPPALTVFSDETSFGALLGTYSWQRKNDDGTSTSTEADSAHPLDCKDLLLPFETTEATAMLRFTENPGSILSVRCWSDEHWSDPTADSEDIPVNGNEIKLKPGGYIYEVCAEWDTEKSGYGGRACYFLYIKVLE